jgi:SAM-dependent methyltransferase
MPPEDPLRTGYDAFYEVWGRSPTWRRIWREHVTGEDFPDEFAHISFISMTELRAVAQGLNLTASQTLVDLACGAAGPSLWIAREHGVRLVGRDLSSVAVERAVENALSLGMSDRADFAQGSFEATGLASRSADAVMSIDALQYAPDKTKALTEVARVLRPGGRFAFVTFELDADHVAGLPVWDDPVDDYRPILEATGFETLSYDQIPQWREHVTAGFGAVIAEQQQLELELGPVAAAGAVAEASITIGLQPYCGHVLGVAKRV